MRDICLAAGHTMTVQDTSGSDIAFAAIVHLAQTIPSRSLRCILEYRDMCVGKTADGPFDVVNGALNAPTPDLLLLRLANYYLYASTTGRRL